MVSYRKVIKKRIEVLTEEIEKYDTEISTVAASVETILREKCTNIQEQSERSERFQDVLNQLTAAMTNKEFLEQRLNELEIMREICKEPET